MSAVPEQSGTPEAYLAFERQSEERHEYLNGHIYLMAGASNNHNLIAANMIATLHSQVRKRPCLVYPSDMRIKVSRAIYTYPDVSVVCGTPDLEDSHQDTLLNPIVIIEVLSPSTESYDRGKKFQNYRTLASLQEYVLILQDSQRIEHYARQQNDQWVFSDVSQPDGVLALTSIDCSLAIADVYEKISFLDEDISATG